MYTLKLFLQTILLPPFGCFILAIIGVVLPYRRIGRALIWLAAVTFILASMPVFGRLVLQGIAGGEPISEVALRDSDAIVLLSAGIYPNAPEYDGRDTASGSTLVRARYAAWLHRRSMLPIMVVGERVVPSEETEAEVTARLIRDEFHIPVRWVAGLGRDTLESAVAARDILAPLKISKIALVTDTSHIGRARLAFEAVGFDVMAAPTGFKPKRALGLRDFLPSAKGFSVSVRAINELLGRVWTHLVGKFL